MSIFSTLLCALGTASLVVHAQTGATASLDFDRTFNVQGEPAQLHYLAAYVVAGEPHRLEVWRDGDRRLRRRTDAAIETLVTKQQGDDEWHMQVFDLKRRIHTDIGRTNLIRLGHMSDWFGMSHALARPAGAYTLSAGSAPAGLEASASACDWFVLTPATGAPSNICWSKTLHVPMLIADAAGREQWRITQWDVGPQGDSVFTTSHDGYVHNDADTDIHGD